MEKLFLVVLLIFFYVFIFLFLGGFNLKKSLTFFVGGGLILVILQLIYFSFYSSFEINLFFLEGNIKINNFVYKISDLFVDKKYGYSGLYFLGSLVTYIFPAFLEEFGKFLIFKKINLKFNFCDSINKFIIGIVYVAIGFSFFETIFYIIKIDNQTFFQLLSLTISRSIISTSSHVLFSMIIGYYFAKATFLKFHIVDNLEISKSRKILKKLEKIPFIKITTISKYLYIRFLFIGFFTSILLHSIYNLLMSFDLIFFAVIIIFIGILFMIKVMFLKSNNTNYNNLKEKIDNLKKLKELKSKINRTI